MAISLEFSNEIFDVNKMTFHYFEHSYKAARKRAAVFSTLRIERGKKLEYHLPYNLSEDACHQLKSDF